MQRFVGFFVIGIILLSIVGAIVEDLDIEWDSRFNYARIVEVDYKAVIVDEPGSNGKIRVTERLTFDIRAASEYNRFWELWRVLPEELIDGVEVTYNVLSVKQVFDDGRAPVIFTQAPQLYWYSRDFRNTEDGLGPGKWFHSEGPYDNYRSFECLLIYVDGLYRETVTFEIEYERFNTVLKYGDCSSLYISPFYGDEIKYLRSFKGQFLIPSDIMPRPGNYSVSTYGTNSNGFAVVESASLNPGYFTFSFELDKSDLKFKPYNKYIEFSLQSFGIDKHIFSQFASDNFFFNDNTVLAWIRQEQADYMQLHSSFRIAKIIVLIIFSAGTFFTVKLTLNTDKRLRIKHSFYHPDTQIEFFRDIPSELDPNFAASLVFCRQKSAELFKDGYAAVMLDLVRKGYLELGKINQAFDWAPGNVLITTKFKQAAAHQFCTNCGTLALSGSQFCSNCGNYLVVNSAMQQLKPLTQTEEHYFNLFLKHSDTTSNPDTPRSISFTKFQKRVASDHENTFTFVSAMKKAVIDIGLTPPKYFQKREYREVKNKIRTQSTALCAFGIIFILIVNLISYQTRLDFAYGSFFILGAAFIVCSVYLRRISGRYVLLTKFGEEEYDKWRGLYKFLNSETLMNERTVVDLVIWEQYLVYATAFGISKKVIKALQLRCPEVMLSTSSSPVFRNSYYRSRSFYRSSSSFSRSTSRSAFSGSVSSGGGYGGGRSGGGGGGH